MLGAHDLVLCAGTGPRVALRERAEAASAAGFSGLSLFVSDYQSAKDAGATDAELRSLLDDLGLAIADIDPLLDWIPGVPPLGDTGFGAFGEDGFYAAAEALGARALNVASFTDLPLEVPMIAEAFAALCRRAASHDLLVHLEFMPFGPVASLETAVDIVERAGEPNGGIMFDTWHWLRSGSAAAGVASIPARHVLGLQINDAPATPADDLVHETLSARRLPGDGDIGVAGILRHLAEGGCRAPVEVEVFSDELAKSSMLDAAVRAATAARRVLEDARR